MVEQTCKSLKDLLKNNSEKIKFLEDKTNSMENLKVNKSEFMNETNKIESDYNFKINNQNNEINSLKNKVKKIENQLEFDRKDLENKIEADVERAKNWIITKTSKNQGRIDDLEKQNTLIENKLDMNIKNIDDILESLKRDTKNLKESKLDIKGIEKINNELNRLLKDFYSFKSKAEDINNDDGDIKTKFKSLKDNYQNFVKDMENFINIK